MKERKVESRKEELRIKRRGEKKGEEGRKGEKLYITNLSQFSLRTCELEYCGSPLPRGSLADGP